MRRTSLRIPHYDTWNMEAVAGYLVVQREGYAERRIALAREILRIGRLPESNDVVLPDQRVSRQHAELHWGRAGLMLKDLKSTHGTLVGEERLEPERFYLLQTDTAFRVGPYRLAYEPLALPDPPGEGPSRYLADLPDSFQDGVCGDFLGRFLKIFESLWEPLERRQDCLDLYFDPRTCPGSFVPWLAGWLGLLMDRRLPERRQRRLIAEAMSLYEQRGTSEGLKRMIEVCTGLTPEIEKIADQPFVFRVTVASSGHEAERAFLEELVQRHKAAHAGYVLEIGE